MNAREFFDTVAKMRQAQKQYFKTRSTEWLIESKGLEKTVDDEIRRVTRLLCEKEEIKGNQGTISPNRIIGTPEHIQVALDVMNEKGGEQ